MVNLLIFQWVKVKKTELKKPYLMLLLMAHGLCYKMFTLCNHGLLDSMVLKDILKKSQRHVMRTSDASFHLNHHHFLTWILFLRPFCKLLLKFQMKPPRIWRPIFVDVMPYLAKRQLTSAQNQMSLKLYYSLYAISTLWFSVERNLVHRVGPEDITSMMVI